MKLILKVILLSRPKEQGFVLPVIIALGLIMTLLGTISIFQSSDEQLTASSQRATAKALAAAEIGVNHYRELIDSNKVIAVYNACETGTWSSANCNDTGTNTSWEQATNIPNINASCSANPSATVAAAATRAWQNINASSPADGQYRLIDYQYDPNYNNNSTVGNTSDDTDLGQPFGILTVEGRVNQSNTLANETQAAVARVEVELPIQPGIPPSPIREIIELEDNFNNFNPALWLLGSTNGTIDASVTNISGGLKVQGNIVVTDTDCNVTNPIPTAANLENITTTTPVYKPSIIISPLRPGDDSSSTTIYKYPRVIVGLSEIIRTDWDKDLDGDGTDDINSLSGINTNTNLPLGTHKSEIRPDGNYYHYVVNGNIDLSDEYISIPTDRKVILYVDGDISIEATAGNTVNINNSTSTKSYHLEIYGTDNTNTITFKGDGTINISALIYAPDAQVEVQGDPIVNITGAVWVRDWNDPGSSTNNVTITSDNPGSGTLTSKQYFNYSYVKNDLADSGIRIVDPVISIPSRWETKQAK